MTQQPNPDDFLGPALAATAATAAGQPVTPVTVKRWADAGLLPALRMPDGRRLVRRSDLAHFLADRAAVRVRREAERGQKREASRG